MLIKIITFENHKIKCIYTYIIIKENYIIDLIDLIDLLI